MFINYPVWCLNCYNDFQLTARDARCESRKYAYNQHELKGLEWKYIYIVNAADKITPSADAKEKNEIKEVKRIIIFFIKIIEIKLFVCYHNNINNAVREQNHGINR